jgi:hypothetical protein
MLFASCAAAGVAAAAGPAVSTATARNRQTRFAMIFLRVILLMTHADGKQFDILRGLI